MRENPDIDQLRRQDRELLEAYRAQSPDAILEVAAYHRTAAPDTFALHDAQFVLARSYGFESWLGHRCGLYRRLPAYARARPGHDRCDGAARWLDRRRLRRLHPQRGTGAPVLEGEFDPHLESGASSGKTVEAILWSGASGRSADIVRMALERIDWPRHDPRWFRMLWRPLPGHQDLNETEQADSRATFRLILERCDPNLRAGESGQTMLHEVIARDHGVGVFNSRTHSWGR